MHRNLSAVTGLDFFFLASVIPPLLSLHFLFYYRYFKLPPEEVSLYLKPIYSSEYKHLCLSWTKYNFRVHASSMRSRPAVLRKLGVVPKWQAGGEGEEDEGGQTEWRARLGRQHRQQGEATALSRKRWGGRLEMRKECKHWKKSYLNGLTVFGRLDDGALMPPDDGGGRGADHVADNDGVPSFVELLRGGSALKSDFFCGDIWNIHYTCL